jgi:hypothetical protein
MTDNSNRIAKEICAYLELPDDIDVVGKKLTTKKVVKLSLTKPQTENELLLVHIPAGSLGTREDDYVILPPGTNIYPKKVIQQGEYFGSLQKKIRFSLCTTNE